MGANTAKVARYTYIATNAGMFLTREGREVAAELLASLLAGDSMSKIERRVAVLKSYWPEVFEEDSPLSTEGIGL